MLALAEKFSLPFLATAWALGFLVMAWSIVRSRPKVKPLDPIHRTIEKGDAIRPRFRDAAGRPRPGGKSVQR
jgi:hypothetical protein